ncbi:TreO [Staphylococcus phage P4W]|uniref:TreO n=1 Tax=Staphylococcus phage P4W TaxID=1195080 RepID=I6WL77_9CAUD|nr:TreO [Staphylococcus phage P4W]YP_009781842.1 TreO [Staphylococcus phage P4W]AFN38873.1 TreO [Staphylococcus phage P4W]AHL83312.1 TreO [Staphylococcus phage P4W]
MKKITTTLNFIGMKNNERFTEELKNYRQDVTFLKANKIVKYSK